MKNTITILGSGFSSLASACYLAKSGYDVTIFEKNSTIGGRARQLKKEGFIFDIGPTWYWMPDVFDSFFNDFNKLSRYLSLCKLRKFLVLGDDTFIAIYPAYRYAFLKQIK